MAGERLPVETQQGRRSECCSFGFLAKSSVLERRFEDLHFYETEAKLDAYEEDFSVALFVAPALLSESALSRTFNPALMRRHSIR